jgi:Sap, sulfolipid-1-addressing protein
MRDLIPLAIASAFWPILIAVVLISLRAPHPVRLMASFLVAGLLTTVGVGLALIYLLQDASLAAGSNSWFGPDLQIAAGVAALVAAYVLRERDRRAASSPKPKRVGPGRMERMLDHGAPLAFLAGVLFNIVPGVVPVVALKQIADLDYPFAETLAVVFAFYVIMFAFIEIPLAGYIVAPAKTAGATERFNGWLDRNGHRLEIAVLALIGVYLIARGVLRIA